MSLLCPIDFRYGRPKMKGVFEEESRLQRLLDVEAALARAEAKVGLFPEEAAAGSVAPGCRRQDVRRRRHRGRVRSVRPRCPARGDARPGRRNGRGRDAGRRPGSLRRVHRDPREPRGVPGEILHGSPELAADGDRRGRRGVRDEETGRKLNDGPEGEPRRLRERVLPLADRAVSRDARPGERAAVARTRPDEQRGGADHPAPCLRPDRRDARADRGGLPDPARLSGPDEGEPRGDERPGDGRGRHDRPRREGTRAAGRPQAHPRDRPEGADERDPPARRPPRRIEGDESPIQKRDRGGDGSERVPRGELRDRRRGRKAGPLGERERLPWTRVTPRESLRSVGASDGPMQFARVVDAYEKIEATTKRLEMTESLVGLLRETPKEDLDKVVYLTQGRIHPDYEGIELGLAEKW